MTFRHRLLLLMTLLLIFTFLVVVSNSEAARIKVKKAVAAHSRKAVAAKRQQLSRNDSSRDSGLRPLPLEEEFLEAELPPRENALLQKAYGLLGIKYRFGGTGYAGIDCSAFVKKVFASQNLPRTAREQYLLGERVPAEELQKGDLLFFQTYAEFPSHVGIYIGNRLMIHASSQGGRVMISRMDTDYFNSRFLGARRIPAEGDGFLWELGKGEEMEKGPSEV
jgi:cell wall-associated NlpC family hydrolase